RGRLLHRLISHGVLNSPWGLVQAPGGFGKFSGALLVGNFGDGHIDAYNIHTGNFIGTLSDAQGVPITIDGLWALEFRAIRTSHNRRVQTLFFSAGPNDESNGLVGRINAN